MIGLHEFLYQYPIGTSLLYSIPLVDSVFNSFLKKCVCTTTKWIQHATLVFKTNFVIIQLYKPVLVVNGYIISPQWPLVQSSSLNGDMLPNIEHD